MAQEIKAMLDDGITDLDALEALGKTLATSVKTSQIRKFFGSLKRIQADFSNKSNEIILLEPRLAYAYGKAKGETTKAGLKQLYETLGPLIKTIKQDKTRFTRFVQVSEAIVAYHKANGGEE